MDALDNIHNIVDEQEIIKVGSWDDLLQDILVLIYNKLYITDQARFRAVCKNWRVPAGDIKRLDRLPWVMKFSWTELSEAKPNVYPFVCELFDPYSQEVFKVSNCIQDFTNQFSQYVQSTLYASKDGWSLLGLTGLTSSLLFLHNPFTNGVIMLPDTDQICKDATLTMNPASPECEILMVCRATYAHSTLNIGRCRLSEDKEWRVKYLELTPKEPISLRYMNGELYCLFYGNILKSYTLSEECWKLVMVNFPEPYDIYWFRKSWLIENENDLLLAAPQFGRFLTIFKMDFSRMSWVVEQNPDNVAFCISGNTLLSAPFEDEHQEILEYYTRICSVSIANYASRYDWNIKCYSLQGRKEDQLMEVRNGIGWIL